jgi:hypothetical protein
LVAQAWRELDVDGRHHLLEPFPHLFQIETVA